MKLPENPTPAQLKQVVQALIRYSLESDAHEIGEIEPTEDGWKTTYLSGGVKYAIEYDGQEFTKYPINLK